MKLRACRQIFMHGISQTKVLDRFFCMEVRRFSLLLQKPCFVHAFTSSIVMQAAKIELKKIFHKTRRLSAICALLFVGTSGVNVQNVPQFREFTPRRGAEKITKLVSFLIAIQFLLLLCMYHCGE